MKKTAFLLAALLGAASAFAQTVKLETSEGVIRVELDAAKAPKTVANFLAYVKSGHYKGTIFHRVIDGFMIQGGGFDAAMTQKTTRAPIPLESHNGLSNLRGTIAMARTAVPNSATSQFFINLVDNPRLDGDAESPSSGYAVFGKVIEGMDVVDKIRAIPVADKGMHQNVPTKTVTITNALIEPPTK